MALDPGIPAGMTTYLNSYEKSKIIIYLEHGEFIDIYRDGVANEAYPVC